MMKETFLIISNDYFLLMVVIHRPIRRLKDTDESQSHQRIKGRRLLSTKKYPRLPVTPSQALRTFPLHNNCFHLRLSIIVIV